MVYFDRQHTEGVAKLQRSASARPAPAFNAGSIVATIVGIPAVVIVVAALNDTSLPIVGSGRGGPAGRYPANL